MITMLRIILLFVFFWSGTGGYEYNITNVALKNDVITRHYKCQQKTVPLCMDIQYNTTIMPNLLNHQNQDDAGLELHQFFPLVKINCSPDLQLFLCSVYVPVCNILERPIPPCKALCLSAKSGCEPIMKTYGFDWPENLDCAQYPEGQEICVGEMRNTNNTEFGKSNLQINHKMSDRENLTLRRDKCEQITVPLCKDIQYNTTLMPNLLNHQNQDDAGLEIHQFFPLVKINCSPDLQLFLCSVYVPVCTTLKRPIPPCRALCLSVKSGCEPIMKTYGFDWPDNLDCAQYPEGQDIDGVACVDEKWQVTTPNLQ